VAKQQPKQPASRTTRAAQDRPAKVTSLAARRAAAAKSGTQRPARPAPKAAAKPASKPAAKPAPKAAPKGAPVALPTPAAAPTAAELQQAANAEMWARYMKKRDAGVRESLILQYAPLVKYVMGRLAISLPSILDYEDILSFGTIGLIEAVERFDPEKGVKFETYAISRIRGAIIDALRSLDRLPRSVRQKAKEADQAIIALTHDLGRDPTDEEVAELLGISPEAYRKHLIDASWVTVSLDANSAGGDEDDDGGEIAVPDPDEQDISLGLEQQELIGELGQAIRELPDREQLVLSLYYKDELTMREVSKVLGISESRVCQLHARALTRLRTAIARIHGAAA
jgi:RNA polymerase sigma factor for flagellar operon FliA